MKLNFTKFIALAVCVLMLMGTCAIAETDSLTAVEGNVSENSAIEFAGVATVASDATKDSAADSDAEEIVTSDAEDVVASDAEDAITSDADEEVKSDSEAQITPSAPSDSTTGTIAGSDALPEDETENEETNEDMALNFSDLEVDDWAYNSILNLVKKGIVSGDTVGTIRPDGNVTREEVAKMMVVARRFAISQDTAIEAQDADSVSDWAKGYFKTAIEKGIINGYTDGTVRGTGEVNRAEMATIIVRSINASIDSFTASSFADITEADWYAKYVECAKTLGIVNGYQDGSFRGEDLVTRREAFAMIERMVRLLEALEA